MEEDAEVAKCLSGNDFPPDYKCFTECLANANSVRGGYWSAFVTMGWISTRSEKFVAAAQEFEVANHAQRGSIFTAASWITLDNTAMNDFGGKSFVEAEAELREALESGRVTGGIATRIGAANPEPIERYQWTAWQRAFEPHGLVLVPGFHNFMWPSEAVIGEFPAAAEPTQNVSFSSPRWQTQKVSDQQAKLFSFFDIAKVHMKGGSHELNRTDLRAKYEEWVQEKERRGLPMKRTAFEKMLDRHIAGWRIKNERWELSH